jgi:hypothetical protein
MTKQEILVGKEHQKYKTSSIKFQQKPPHLVRLPLPPNSSPFPYPLFFESLIWFLRIHTRSASITTRSRYPIASSKKQALRDYFFDLFLR